MSSITFLSKQFLPDFFDLVVTQLWRENNREWIRLRSAEVTKCH